MAHVLVTGGKGHLGTAVVPLLEGAGHDVSVTSRKDGPGVRRLDLTTGDGLEAALEGVDVVLHSATLPRQARAVDVEGTERLVRAMKEMATARLVFPSIVGIDRVPYAYYRAKLAAERIIEESGVPFTTVRITQFHDLLDGALRGLARFPVMPLPAGWVFQPIDLAEAAAAVAPWVDADPAGLVPDVGGPEVRRFSDLARSWAKARGKRRLRLSLPFPNKASRGFRRGLHTCPERAVGTVTWEQYLAR